MAAQRPSAFIRGAVEVLPFPSPPTPIRGERPTTNRPHQQPFAAHPNPISSTSFNAFAELAGPSRST